MPKHKLLKPVVKGLTWRVFAAADTLVITAGVMYWHTGSIGSGVFAVVGGIVGAELFTKTALYTAHERLWELKVLRKLFEPAEERR